MLATAGTVALAGCLGGGGAATGSPEAATRSSATGTPQDVTELSSLDVGPSPGGTLPVREPGTVSLVDFFATWCAPCKPQMATLNAVREEYGDDELYMTSITAETDEAAVREFWTEYDGSWPVLLDPEVTVTEAFDVTGIPTLVLLDGTGVEQWRHVGLAGEDDIATAVDEATDR